MQLKTQPLATVRRIVNTALRSGKPKPIATKSAADLKTNADKEA